MPFISKERIESLRSLQAAKNLYALGCEADLQTFFRKSWEILEPTTPLLSNWHHGILAEYLEACHLRQIQQIIFNLPPRYAKSNLVTIAFPCWVWAKEPEERFMFFSYAQTLATKHSVDRRTLIESAWYQKNWGSRFQLAVDQNLKTEFSNDKRGHMVAAPVLGGGGLGKGGNILIVDDPIDPLQANSDSRREAVNQAFGQKIRQRVDSEARGVKIITMQRTHEQDLTGDVISKERDKWTWVRIPAIAPARVYYRFPLSGYKQLVEKGDALHPERHNVQQLQDKKRAIGTYAYSGQYDQAPSPAGGTILKRHWWKYYKVLPDRFDSIRLGMDCAFKGEEDSSAVCIEIWGKRGADFFLIHEINDQLDFVASRNALEQVCKSPLGLRVSRKLIEDKANGPAIIASLQKLINGLIPYPVKSDKVSRARAVSHLPEAGNVWLPHPDIAPWVGDFVGECAAFPKGTKADRVDTMSMVLHDFITSESGEFTAAMAEPNRKPVQVAHTTIKGAVDKW